MLKLILSGCIIHGKILHMQLEIMKLQLLKNETPGEQRIELPDGSYSVKDISDAIINDFKYQTGNDFPGPILSGNPIYNSRVVLNIRAGYHIAFTYEKGENIIGSFYKEELSFVPRG